MSSLNPQPRLQRTDFVNYRISASGNYLPDQYEVLDLKIRMGVNRISDARISFSDGNPHAQNFGLSDLEQLSSGALIKIELGYHQDYQLLFQGFIVSKQIKVRGNMNSELIVLCQDKTFRLAQSHKTRVYLNQTDSDIIRSVFQQHGLESRVENSSELQEKIVQYQANDWEFILSRAESQGMLVVSSPDHLAVKKPNLEQRPVLILRYGNDILKMNMEMDSRTQFDSFRAKAWDIGTQKTEYFHGQESNSSDSEGLDSLRKEKEFFISLTGDDKEPQSWIDQKVLRSRLSKKRGVITTRGHAEILPDKWIEVNGLGSEFSGFMYVSSVIHQVSAGSWTTETEIGLEPDLHLSTEPQATGGGLLIPGISTLCIGKVSKIHPDPQSEFRIEVNIPSFDSQNLWARMIHPYAGENSGITFYPEIGDEVLLGFTDSDPRCPVVLGSVHSNKRQTPLELGEKNRYKGIVSRSGVKIIWDEENSGLIMTTPGGREISLDDTSKEMLLKDDQGNTVTLSDNGIRFKTAHDLIIETDGDMSLVSGRNLNLKAKQNLSLEAMNIQHSAKSAMDFKSTKTEVKATIQLKLEGGLIMIN